MKNYFLIFLLLATSKVFAVETITIKAADGVDVTIDLYMVHADTIPLILLFHQAGWSRGEYQEIAPKLNKFGFNCIAIDQRSGKSVNNIENKTFLSARKNMKETRYIDALKDMTAAIAHVKKYFAKGQLIVWGSSYSSSLVLKLAGDQPEDIDGVLAFSPGEYFASMGKPRDFIKSSAMNIECPSFITSAKGEYSSWKVINEAIPTNSKRTFLPQTSGNHGSRALWSKFSDSPTYWSAVKDFLSQYQN